MKDLHAIFQPGAIEKLNPVAIDRIICALFYPQYDPGPNCSWERLFQTAPVDHYVTFPQAPFHTRFGPVFYRGRLDGTARVLVIGQDPSTDEILAQRIFVGQAGQIAQHFLGKLGLTRSYLMFNSFLFGVQSTSLSGGAVSETEATIMAYRNSLFDHAQATNPLTAIIAFGSHANNCALNWPGRGSLPIIHLTHPTAPSGVAANWNSHLAAAQNVIAPDSDGHVDTTPYSTSGAMPHLDIPRRDLPFGLPAWHGAGGGTQSQRGAAPNFESQIIWSAP
ncbi:uracil-DNA glycosylase family protein [Sphingomonas echinoides]|uniref:Uracil-DNA glycosylase family protein n=1 Tax=Sphingomonas echinoides TaxID=59803 RepID=A0ABU4PI48_9SPHN|nr:uracil-DNA glycosylase family protein [Sphingomonas echinoides]MDX5983868.1 uracil-DNA glycosylase family protein [Sphingomonas echinoides]